MNIRDVINRFMTMWPNAQNSHETDASPRKSDPVKIGIWVLIIGFGGFLFWAAFAPLDEGVPSEGVVTIATKAKVIQHLYGGVVKKVHVKEGHFVDVSEVLISLERSNVKARYEEVHQHYLGLRAAESRLIAEQSGASKIVFHDDLLNDPDKSLTEALMVNQKRLFGSQRKLMHLLSRQLAGVKDLVKDGYAPLDQQWELEKQIAEMEARTAQELAQVRLEVDADAEKSIALKEQLDKTEIRSPVAGQVVGLQVQTVGAVIKPGEKIMDIVPLDESLLVEVKVAPHLIDRIYAGLFADVRFTSFSHSPQLVVEGKVESVSKGLLTDPRMNPVQPGASYYLALISITPEGLKVLADRKLQPGMPVQAVIKTGERSFLTYLMNPLIKRVSASMKEE